MSNVPIPKKDEVTIFFNPCFVRNNEGALSRIQMGVEVRKVFMLLEVFVTESGIADFLPFELNEWEFPFRTSRR